MDVNMKTNNLFFNFKTFASSASLLYMLTTHSVFGVQPPASRQEILSKTDLIAEGQIIDIKYVGTKKNNNSVQSIQAKSVLAVSKIYDKSTLQSHKPAPEKQKITIKWQTLYKDSDLKKNWVGPAFAQFGEIGEEIYVYLKANDDESFSAVSYNAKCNKTDNTCKEYLDGKVTSASCTMKNK